MDASDLEVEVNRLRNVNAYLTEQLQRVREENNILRNDLVITTSDIAAIRERIGTMLARVRGHQ